MRDKDSLSVCLSVCLWVSEESWIIYVFEIFISDESIKEGKIHAKRHLPDSCSHSFANQPARTKTVDKKSQNKESVASR